MTGASFSRNMQPLRGKRGLLRSRVAILINTARGKLIDDSALAVALKSGKIKGAGLDVLTLEPPKDGNPLFGIENCIITPHISWAAVETRQRLVGIVAENLSAFLNSTPQNEVF